MVLLVGVEALHVFSQVLTAVEEVRQGDEDGFSCSDGKETDVSKRAEWSERDEKLLARLDYVRPN